MVCKSQLKEAASKVLDNHSWNIEPHQLQIDKTTYQWAYGIEDIFDGELYKEFIEQGLISDNDKNFTFVFNTDGFSLFKHHTLNIWVLLVRLNELPPALRQRHLFLAGLWIDSTKKPNMNTFLRPFVRQVNRLSSQGIQWRPLDGDEVTSKFYPIGCCVDAQCPGEMHRHEHDSV